MRYRCIRCAKNRGTVAICNACHGEIVAALEADLATANAEWKKVYSAHVTAEAELASLRAELASVKAVCQRAADWLRSHRDCAEGDAATVCELVAAAKEGV